MIVALLVEDEELPRKSLSQFIKTIYADNVALHEKSNGWQAVQLAREIKPDIVFMDVQMPVMNGFTAAKKILEESPGTDIYILTAYDYFHYAQKAVEIGIKGYILKPPKMEDIQAAFDKFAVERQNKTQRPVQREEPAEPDCAPGIPIHIQQYPYKAERAFFNDLQLHDIDGARASGAKMLDLLLAPDNGLTLVKEYINEFFVTSKRALANFGYCEDDEMHLLELKKVFYLQDLPQIREWAHECLWTLLDICQKKSGPSDARKKNVLNAIENDLVSVTLESLAQQEGVSKSYISRAFSSWTGETFTAYMTRKRIEKAKILLESTTDKIEDISVQAGYSDINYFCRIFKNEVGISPTKYRGYKSPKRRAL